MHLLGSDTIRTGCFFPGCRAAIIIFPISGVTLPPANMNLDWRGEPSRKSGPPIFSTNSRFFAPAGHDTAAMRGEWQLAEETKNKVSKLSWQGGMENWFHRHFCHAARVIGEASWPTRHCCAAGFLTSAPGGNYRPGVVPPLPARGIGGGGYRRLSR